MVFHCAALFPHLIYCWRQLVGVLVAEPGQLMPRTGEYRPSFCVIERLEHREFGFGARVDFFNSAQQRAAGIDQILDCLSRQKCRQSCGLADSGVLGCGK